MNTIESFKNFSNAENYLNLYKNFLRFKPYTDCKGTNKFMNGKTPLEIYGVMLKSKDWLKNALTFYLIFQTLVVILSKNITFKILSFHLNYIKNKNK